ncbi:MAG: hypothetical protein ACYDDF_00295 [Thermoplasmatota archaeon]
MKVLGVLTEDFAVSYELVHLLKNRGLPFVTLAKGERIPPNVGVIVTTAAEASAIDAGVADVVVFSSARDTVEEATRILGGKRWFSRVVVGIDPGEKPGVAVLGDGHVVRSIQVRMPEQAAAEVAKARRAYSAESFIVRVGHGAPTYRDRILRALQGLDVRIELVDETASTPATWRRAEERDTQAAEAIALERGFAPPPVREIHPSDGELRDIQRKSRLASQGRVTIGRALARSVAVGELTLAEAIRRQQGKHPHAS